MSREGHAAVRLGAALGHSEARGMAERVEAGFTLSQSLVAVNPMRRDAVRSMLDDAGLSNIRDPEVRRVCALVLRAAEGAGSRERPVTPFWSAPEGLALSGPLNSSRAEMVRGATRSVVCSTYNFQRSSSLWDALKAVAQRPGVSVKVYVDTRVADTDPKPWKPTTAEIATELKGAAVFRTKPLVPGLLAPCNHAKFVSVDSRDILVTSANFSGSAESDNVELGLRIEDERLARSVERQMRDLEDEVYERVAP